MLLSSISYAIISYIGKEHNYEITERSGIGLPQRRADHHRARRDKRHRLSEQLRQIEPAAGHRLRLRVHEVEQPPARVDDALAELHAAEPQARQRRLPLLHHARRPSPRGIPFRALRLLVRLAARRRRGLQDNRRDHRDQLKGARPLDQLPQAQRGKVQEEPRHEVVPLDKPRRHETRHRRTHRDRGHRHQRGHQVRPVGVVRHMRLAGHRQPLPLDALRAQGAAP